jgi:hypothetical protein
MSPKVVISRTGTSVPRFGFSDEPQLLEFRDLWATTKAVLSQSSGQWYLTPDTRLDDARHVAQP